MWVRIVEELKKTESKHIIEAFIQPLKPIKESETEIVVGAPSDQMIQVLEKNSYIKKIREIAHDLFSSNMNISFIVKANSLEDIQPLLPISESVDTGKRKHKSTVLNENYIFNNFVPGPSNETAFAAAMAIAKNPGVNYNPLVIYGETGLGKTHIIQAVGNFLKIKHKSICYITTQQFVNEFVSALQHNKLEQLRTNLLGYDILLVDDIQFLAKKEKTEDLFFDIFNEYQSTGRQIMITSDRYPGEIKDIQDRLRSRFVWGVSFEIKPPEYETRLAIVRKKSELYGIKLDVDIAEFIAKNIKNNVREIEGALKTLQISAELFGKKIIDKPFTEKMLKDIIKVKTNITIDDIIKMASTYMKVKISDINGTGRTKQIALSRHIAIYLAKKYSNSTLIEIGDKFGGRNHSTILSSIAKIEKDMMDDINIRKIVETLERAIKDNEF